MGNTIMAKDTKNNIKKPKFSPYWIYGLIIAAFLAVQIFSGGFGEESGKKISPTEFFEFLKQGDVKEVEIVNNREARVFLTKEALEKEIHKGTQPKSIFPSVSATANYKFEFGDLKLFQEEINEIKEEYNLNTPVQFNSEENVWGNFFFSLLPFILMFLLTIYYL